MKVQTLNAAWRKYLTDQMGMDDKSFLLAQGNLGLQTTDSSGLFLMADAVPPNTSLFDAGGTRSYSAGCGLLLQALLPESGTDLAATLGDNYTRWIDYRSHYFKENPTSDKSQADVFKQFANQQLDPNLARQAIAVFAKAAQSPLTQSLDAFMASSNSQKFTSPSGQSQTLRVYSPTIDNAKSELNTGTRLDIKFTSQDVQSQLSQTQIQAAASGFYEIFSAGASGGLDQLNTKAASSGFTISGYINKYKTVSVQRGGWFPSVEYSRAYTAQNDNTIWDPQASAGNWGSFFAQPNGSIARRVTQLLLVTDYSITVTSQATYSQQDLQTITAQASFGIWPFFSASSSYNHTTKSTLNSQSQLETTFTLNNGLVQIWGVSVQNAPN